MFADEINYDLAPDKPGALSRLTRNSVSDTRNRRGVWTSGSRSCLPNAGERRGNNLNSCQDFRTENGSSQGQNLSLTGLFVPSSLDKDFPRLASPFPRTPPWRQPRDRWMFFSVNSHTNATSKRWHLWEIDSRFALNSTPRVVRRCTGQ